MYLNRMLNFQLFKGLYYCNKMQVKMVGGENRKGEREGQCGNSYTYKNVSWKIKIIFKKHVTI